jgi:hypothetical protein
LKKEGTKSTPLPTLLPYSTISLMRKLTLLDIESQCNWGDWAIGLLQAIRDNPLINMDFLRIMLPKAQIDFDRFFERYPLDRVKNGEIAVLETSMYSFRGRTILQ